MGQDILKQCCHDVKTHYVYSRLTVHKGVSCDRNVMEYSNEEYCGMHGNSHYLIQFDAIQVLKFCEDPSKVCLRNERQLTCHCASSGSCTDTRCHRFSNCNENREELHVKSHDILQYHSHLFSMNSCVHKISPATHTPATRRSSMQLIQCVTTRCLWFGQLITFAIGQ
jgi:hypothetical protein